MQNTHLSLFYFKASIDEAYSEQLSQLNHKFNNLIAPTGSDVDFEITEIDSFFYRACSMFLGLFRNFEVYFNHSAQELRTISQSLVAAKEKILPVSKNALKAVSDRSKQFVNLQHKIEAAKVDYAAAIEKAKRIQTDVPYSSISPNSGVPAIRPPRVRQSLNRANRDILSKENKYTEVLREVRQQRMETDPHANAELTTLHSLSKALITAQIRSIQLMSKLVVDQEKLGSEFNVISATLERASASRLNVELLPPLPEFEDLESDPASAAADRASKVDRLAWVEETVQFNEMRRLLEPFFDENCGIQSSAVELRLTDHSDSLLGQTEISRLQVLLDGKEGRSSFARLITKERNAKVHHILLYT